MVITPVAPNIITLKPKNLLTQLSELESSLNNFSFEELSSEEAGRLQRSFLTFKNQLETKVWGEEAPKNKAVENTAELKQEQRDLRRIAAACHQMRTPLNALLGLTDLLRESDLNPEQKYHVQAIQEAHRGLMNMCVELTDFARLFAGLEVFEKVAFNLPNLLDDVQYLCNTLILDNRLKLNLNLDQAIPKRLTGDPSKLSQILLHLLGTKLKMETEGSIEFDIQFQHQEGETVYLEFLIASSPDNELDKLGLAKDKPAIHPAFTQGRDIGLGLSIVKQLIKHLGGEFFLQDNAVGAPDYAFRLPFEPAREDQSNRREQLPLKGMRILLIEHNPLNQRMTEKRLRSWGCIPHPADNPGAALRILDETFDLVLVDIQPDKPVSMEMLTGIRKLSNITLRNIPILAITGNISEKELKNIAEKGATDCILKPYNADELLSKLRPYHRQKNRTVERLPSAINNESLKCGEERPIDLSPLLEDCMGNMETLEELLTLFRKKSLEFIGSLKLHLDRSDYKGISFSCQKVGSSLKVFNAESLMVLVGQINKACQSNEDLRHLKFLHRCFVEEYPLVQAALDKAFEELKKK